MAVTETEIGPFVVGEIPAPLIYQFLDEDGTAISMIDSYVARFSWGRRDPSSMLAIDQVLSSATFVDSSTGRVQYVWDGTEFAKPGRYVGEFWAGNGVNRFASILITWTVRIAIGQVPSI